MLFRSLFGSGMVAGEGVIGILLAVFTVLGISDKINIFSGMNESLFNILGAVLLVATIVVYFVATKSGIKNKKD